MDDYHSPILLAKDLDMIWLSAKIDSNWKCSTSRFPYPCLATTYSLSPIFP